MRVQVMSFNLRVMVESDGANAWKNRFHLAAQTIKESGADIVCTQEGMHDMLQDLEALLPAYSWIGEGRSGGRKDEYCAVFYRTEAFQAIDHGHFGLSEEPDTLGYRSWNSACARMCTWVRLKSAEGQEFVVFNTHLDHVSEEARVNGMRMIIERMQAVHDAGGQPVILTGDFNAEPSSEALRILEQSDFRNAYSALPEGAAEAGRTFHNFRGGESGEPIDYIFATADSAIEQVTIDRRQFDDSYPSDHYPVIARILLPV